MIEPGAKLAGRYRLEDLVNEASGAALWKATDEILARPVAVWTFTPNFPRTGDAVRAARAASRASDARLTQVFDADDRGPMPYVVEEWVAGQSLAELLAQGPPETERATGLIAEAAEALASANAAGLFHLCLTPRKLIWTSGGSIKITGTCVDAALRGITAEDPAAADAVGLGRLLYAALTAHWPGGGGHGLRPAPVAAGVPCDPSQVRAGIPENVNDIVRRSAFQSTVRHALPLRSSREVADALGELPRAVPLPVAPASLALPEPPSARANGNGATEAWDSPGSRAAPTAHSAPAAYSAAPERSSITSRILVGAVALLVLVAVIVGAWSVGSAWNSSTTAAEEEEEGEDSQGGGADSEDLEVLSPQDADGFDPLGEDGDEHGDKADLAIDGDSSTAWNTQGYNSAEFGNLKEGVGFILDMGEPVQLSEVDLALGSGGADLELRVGDAPNLGELPSIHEDTGVSGDVAITLDEPVEGRYVLIWFTKLPQDGGRYRAVIHDVELRGTP